MSSAVLSTRSSLFSATGKWLLAAGTIILFAAVIVGGRGNNFGAVVGALLVPVGFEEVTRFIPSRFGSVNLPVGFVPALEWVVIGLLIIGFLWFRPKGVLPEKPGRFAAATPVVGARLTKEPGVS